MFAAILATTWTKSSFAMTLLSISEGRTRRLVWVVLISINLVLGVHGALQWVGCWPPQKLWRTDTPGICWFNPRISRPWNTFVAGGCRVLTTLSMFVSTGREQKLISSD